MSMRSARQVLRYTMDTCHLAACRRMLSMWVMLPVSDTQAVYGRGDVAILFAAEFFWFFMALASTM